MRGRINIGILVPSEDLLHPGSVLGRDAKNVDQDLANTSRGRKTDVVRNMARTTTAIPAGGSCSNIKSRWTLDWSKMSNRKSDYGVFVSCISWYIRQSHRHFCHPLTESHF